MIKTVSIMMNTFRPRVNIRGMKVRFSRVDALMCIEESREVLSEKFVGALLTLINVMLRKRVVLWRSLRS